MNNHTLPDSTQRFIFENSDIRGELVHLDNSYQDILNNHHYPPILAALLGEFATAAVLLSSTIKFDGKLSLQVRSEGQVSMMMAECSNDLALRAIAHLQPPEKSIPLKSNFSQLFYKGVMAITIEPKQGERYQSMVPLDGENLAQCLEHYFLQSEQLATQLHFATNEQRAAGFMLQQLPTQLEKNPLRRQDLWQHARNMAQTLGNEEMLGLDNSALLYRLFNQDQVRLFESKKVCYRCSCSQERTALALVSIGLDELLNILEERGEISVNCEFCNSQYQFDSAAVTRLFETDS